MGFFPSRVAQRSHGAGEVDRVRSVCTALEHIFCQMGSVLTRLLRTCVAGWDLRDTTLAQHIVTANIGSRGSRS